MSEEIKTSSNSTFIFNSILIQNPNPPPFFGGFVGGLIDLPATKVSIQGRPGSGK